MCMDCAENVDWENWEDDCMDMDDEDDMMECYAMTMPCAAECWPSEDCMDCFEDEFEGHGSGSGSGHGGPHNNLLVKAFEHGRPTDDEIDEAMRHEGVPEDCLEPC